MSDARSRRIALLSLHSSPIAPLGRADVGGMNVYVRKLAERLGAEGIDVDVFTRREDRETPAVQALGPARVIQLDAGPARHLPKSVLPLHVPAMAAALRTFVQREELAYDVLHSHYWLSGLAVTRYRALTRDPTPLVHMFHTLSKLKEFFARQPDSADSALRFDGERCLIGRADVIVGATEAEGREMERLYSRSPAEFAIIPPGVDLDLFFPRPKLESRRLLGIGSRYVVLFVGRWDRLKGLDVLLRSVAALPPDLREQLDVLLVGGDERGWSRYARLIARLGLDDVVQMRGKVPHDDLPAFYSAADICAMPSAYESFGIVALEAMACGTPVVAFRVGGLTETISDGQTGFLVPPGHHSDYTRALLTALCHSDLERMGRRARLSVQPYSWERTTAQTLDLYESVIARRSLPWCTA